MTYSIFVTATSFIMSTAVLLFVFSRAENNFISFFEKDRKSIKMFYSFELIFALIFALSAGFEIIVYSIPTFIIPGVSTLKIVLKTIDAVLLLLLVFIPFTIICLNFRRYLLKIKEDDKEEARIREEASEEFFTDVQKQCLERVSNDKNSPMHPTAQYCVKNCMFYKECPLFTTKEEVSEHEKDNLEEKLIDLVVEKESSSEEVVEERTADSVTGDNDSLEKPNEDKEDE